MQLAHCPWPVSAESFVLSEQHPGGLSLSGGACEATSAADEEETRRRVGA